MKSVTEAEFKEFVNNYPNTLHQSVIKKAHPPKLEYNDFSKGNYPESLVCWANLYDSIRDFGGPDENRPNEYYISN